MKLKKLEIYGFKSFADRTVFDFEDDLSALVGPNGSGKSNVVDALRWVLGERSAHKLRGTEMANVIFNGGKGRKPLNFAEVKLTIDNASGWLQVDFEEVCIRRRVDRTGQSEYSINGRNCRLKDIRGLLMDTGVGTSSYSFIEQGQIDRILRSSPKERRKVFEEAAGINRFLEQKREAERKLERVGQNLARVNDILEEVQRQLRSVKYQAARARTFKKHTEELQRLRLGHGLHSVRGFQTALAEQAEGIRGAETGLAGVSQQTTQSESELEQARTGLQAAQEALAESRQALTRIEARRESLTREAELNLKRHEEFQGRLDELAAQRSGLQERARALAEEMVQAVEQLEGCAVQVDDTAARFETGQQQIESVTRQCRRLEEDLETRKTAVFDLFQREAGLHNQSEVLGAERRALQNRCHRIDGRERELGEQIDLSEAERRQAQEGLEGLQGRQRGMDARMAELRAGLTQAREALQSAVAAETDARAELKGHEGRRDVLQDLETRAEGIRSGVKRILEAELPGTVGLVAEAVDVPLELAPAVEAALGDRVQAIIVEHAFEAQRALQTLAQDRAGRAELIVLDQLRPPHRVDLPPVPCVRGRLADMVRCEGRASAALQAVLANVFLVDDAQAAQAMAEAGLPEGVLLVTPQGETCNSLGVWAAGVPETPSLISRRSELVELAGHVERLQRSLAKVAQRKREITLRINVVTRERDELAGRLDTLKQNTGEMRSRLQVVGSRLAELREELNLVRAERQTLRQDIHDLDAQAGELKAKSEQVVRERADAQSAVESLQSGLRERHAQRQALSEELSGLGRELARLREQQRSLQHLSTRLGNDKRHRESELAALVTAHTDSVRRREEAAAAAKRARAESEAMEGQRVARERSIQEGATAIERQRVGIDTLAERLKQLAQKRHDLEEQLHGLRMAENETSIKMQDLLERIAEDYGVRLQALELAPEAWREQNPFTSKLIEEYVAPDEQPVARPPVAAWYSQAAHDDAPEAEAEEEAPELIKLEAVLALRDSVLEMADSPETPWAEVQAEIAKLKAKVDRIGNVNVAAIREQDELETRLQFMTDQKEDLDTSRRHQREIIRELNRKSRERFREVFEQVRENFQGLFRKLFGGGSADIVLVYDEEEGGGEGDILEAGIDLTARPPGKETASITLLSGGERALTTVALLFAMFQAKPSPFCLLDEVDAPLDDSNVERLMMLLDDFRESTQFIIITHNKITMSVAQVLYGLTMADGVSKKISVKFEEVDHRLAELDAPAAQGSAAA